MKNDMMLVLAFILACLGTTAAVAYAVMYEKTKNHRIAKTEKRTRVMKALLVASIILLAMSAFVLLYYEYG